MMKQYLTNPFASLIVTVLLSLCIDATGQNTVQCKCNTCNPCKCQPSQGITCESCEPAVEVSLPPKYAKEQTKAPKAKATHREVTTPDSAMRLSTTQKEEYINGKKVVGRVSPEQDAKRLNKIANDSTHAQMRELMDKPEYEDVKYYEKPERYKWADDSITETIEELLPEFLVSDGRYVPKNASFEHKESGVFLYFIQGEDGRLSPLHLRIQYCDNGSMDFYEAEFLIDHDDKFKDEFTYCFTPLNIRRGTGPDKKCWEVSDDIISGNDAKDLLYAVSHCVWTRMTLKGRRGSMTVSLSDEQIQDIYNTIQLYRLMGGVIK